jgi:rhomboid family GlyGly-CTERM serine protease
MKTRIPFLTLAIAALAVAVHLLPVAASALQFDRAAIVTGEWWRLFTAHVTHFEANHLAWDVAVLLVLGWLCERESRAHVVAALGASAVAITSVVMLAQPQFQTYRGLSGLDCALFGLLAGWLLRNDEKPAQVTGAVALVGVLAKSALELSTGETVFATGHGYAPVPLAHLVGAAVGAITATIRAPSFSAAENSVHQIRGLVGHTGFF